MGKRQRLVVVGHGMVGQRLVEQVVAADPARQWAITVIGEERRPAYDRVALSSWFAGATADDLNLVPAGFVDEHGIDLVLGDPVTAVDRGARTVHTASGRAVAYDHLVLATGSRPFVPPVPGNDLPGCFVYRTIDDLEAITAWAARSGVTAGAVIGGGLLGLEAAEALRCLGLDTHVVEFAPRLMPAQLDARGAAALAGRVAALGVTVHTDRATEVIEAGADGTVARLRFAERAGLDVQLVVFSAGIRPADEVARACGLEVGERGGVVVDERLRTSDPAISAVGECAHAAGRTWGLVGPGYAMARTLAADLCGGTAEPFAGGDLSTKLKLLGIDVASFGDAHAAGPDVHELVWHDPLSHTYRKVLVSARDGRVVGGMLVGDASGYAELAAMARGDLPTPAEAGALALPEGGRPEMAATSLPDAATVCSCEHVSAGDLRGAVGGGCTTIGDLKALTRAGTGCGGCVPQVTNLLKEAMAANGLTVDDRLCEHFPQTRQELFLLVRMGRHATFGEVVAAHGQGTGCEICKPAVASILASLSTGHVLDADRGRAQDTNDFALANLQRNGTYSVVPRVPGGEITPERLIVLGEVARDFGLYTKITGGQRIDLFGARLEQLPAVWARLVDAGFESGHAYGKALRTVKSCVGKTWCRYGVQDSTTLAIDLELRYRGLRAPHKIKMAVSGCARECAEAQSKDVGVIATERGWDLYVAGNGGQRPRHADVLATDLDTGSLVRLVDRFLMFYIRTADRLERTSTWFDKLDGTVEQRLDWLRSVLIDDSLGICDELDEDMARHVETYECEWAATLADPDRLRRFVSFVNAPDAPDPSVVFVSERGQIRPAQAHELPADLSGGAAGRPVVAAGEVLVEVRS